jgi:hypothetical protein
MPDLTGFTVTHVCQNSCVDRNSYQARLCGNLSGLWAMNGRETVRAVKAGMMSELLTGKIRLV